MNLTFPCTLTIEVTQEDIDRGLPRNCGHCPVALAVMRATGFEEVYVSAWSMQLYRKGSYVPGGSALTPKEAAGFIDAFDGRGACPEPFSFTVDFKAVQP